MATIDEFRANVILSQAIDVAQRPGYQPRSRHRQQIELVILGSHLTYRYVLVTGLLGKATNPNVNPICLQAGAPLAGAYDARSLCHSVIVPAERERLNGSLGRSNEPFLNKPARFTHLSTDNAVRKGKDAQTLRSVINILSSLHSSEEAYDGLCDSIHFALQRGLNAMPSLFVNTDAESPLHLIRTFISMVMEHSVEGQCAAVLVGACLRQWHDSWDTRAQVLVHPANQSGASTREVCDIDILLHGEVVGGFEVKDKDYTNFDVDHAAFKAARSGLPVIGFIEGPRGRIIRGDWASGTAGCNEYGIEVIRNNIFSFSDSMLITAREVSVETFWEHVKSVCADARVKDEVYNIVLTSAISCGLVE